jgi:hypothetical protein
MTLIRGEATVKADLIGDEEDSPLGFWAERDLSRRRYGQVDDALLRDVAAVLMRHGAEE